MGSPSFAASYGCEPPGLRRKLVAIAHATDEPVPPSERSDQPIPEELERVIMACLQKDPGARPESALAFAEQLGACKLDDSWTDRDAEAWWNVHLASQLARDESVLSKSEQPTVFLRPAD
jgi:serine/threonine protein kinase